ncbi:MAG: RidA family protein [Verrucomicrobiales bacterium]
MTLIATDTAPAAIGPYSQAVATPAFIFTSGQLPIDPLTGAFVPGGIAEQTAQVLRNLQAVLQAGGSGLDRIVKTTVFLKDMNDFAAMNTVYATFFPINPPARSTIEVARLPKDALVEIEAVAARST